MRQIFILTLALMTGMSAWAETKSPKRVKIPYLGRTFQLVVPSRTTTKKLPLLVLLHGCKQSPDLILEGTRLEAEAQKNQFYILVPEQPAFYNMDHCWNWFMSFQQMRLPTTEMGQIISMIDYVTHEYPIAKDKRFLAGMSSGGAMAHSIYACYPDYFSGVAIHSGLAFKSAENMSEASSILTSEDQKDPEDLGKWAYRCGKSGGENRARKVIIIHGANDKRVLPLHAELTAKTTEVMSDYWDDGERNHSQEVETTTKTLKFPNQYSAKIRTRTYGSMTEQTILVKGMAHAWGGGSPISPNFDEKAPSSNDFILKFFGLKK